MSPLPQDPRPLADRRLWQIAPVRDVCLVGLLVFGVWFGYYLRGIFTPLLIALALAYLFDPLITIAHRRWRMPRPLSIVLLMVFVVLPLGLFAVWLVWALVDQAGQLVAWLSGWLDKLAAAPADGADHPRDWAAMVKQLIVDWDLQQHIDALRADPMAAAIPALKAMVVGGGQVAGAIGGVLGAVTYVGLSLLLIPIYFFFFAWHFGPMIGSLRQYLPAKRRERILHIAGRMDKAVAAFVRGRMIIAGILGLLYAIGFYFCGVPYWLVLGVVGGVLSLIPFIGGIVWPLAMGLAYLNLSGGPDGLPEGWYWSALVGPTVVFSVVQFLEGWVLTPWIGGKAVHLDTVTMIVVVFIGGAVGGMYGLLLCVPIAACIRILMIESILPALRIWARDN